MGTSTGIICGQTQPIFQTTPGPQGLNDASVPNNTQQTDPVGWNSAHLIRVIESLTAASAVETKERKGVDRYLVSLLNQGMITQQDYEYYTPDYYYWVRAMLPYFVQKGRYIRQYDWFEHNLRNAASVPSNDLSEQQFMAKVAFPFMSKNICAAVKNMDMTKAKKLLKEWFKLLDRIEEKRVAAVRLMTVAIENKIKTHREEILKQHLFHLKARENIDFWFSTLNDAKKITKFVDELKEIKDLSDDLLLGVNIFKNPLKTFKDQVLGDTKSMIMDGMDKWDVIKSGIMMIGRYYAHAELATFKDTTLKLELDKLSQSAEAILEHSMSIIKWKEELPKISVLGEMNLAIMGVNDWGRLD